MSRQKSLLVVDLGITDPYFNLAVEAYLYDNYSDDSLIFILWQNDNTVVLGLNQSVFSQCDLDEIKSRNIHVARRRSGGGAVYHDMGNLNYTFISGYYDNVCADNMKTVVDALLRSGIQAELSGRNDITVEGRKISGNAFYRDDTKICHHGTLLVDADMSVMYKILNVDPLKWKDKGIASARSRTVNLKDIDDRVTVDMIKRSLVDTVISQHPDAEIRYCTELSGDEAGADQIAGLAGTFSSADWIYGKKLNETLQIKERFPWGTVEIQLLLEKNTVSDCVIYSDAMETEIIKKISSRINNAEFCRLSLEKALEMNGLNDSEQTILSDILKLIAAETPY